MDTERQLLDVLVETTTHSQVNREVVSFSLMLEKGLGITIFIHCLLLDVYLKFFEKVWIVVTYHYIFTN